MAKNSWSQGELDTLSECAENGLTAKETTRVLPARTAAACAKAASKNEISFNSARHTDLRNFLADGGTLLREDIGGSVGIRWGRAHRSGTSFNPQTCEFFLRVGLIRHREGERYAKG